MPINGLVFQAEAVRFFAVTSASGSHTGAGTGSYGHSATAGTLFTPDSLVQAIGFEFDLSGASVGDTWSVDYTGPGAPLGITWTGSGWTPVTIEIILTDVKVYNLGGNFRFVCAYEVIAQGVTRLTGSIDTISGGLGPSYLPVWGIPLQLSGGASASTTGLPTYGPTDTYAYYSDCTATATGGWQIDQGAGYVGLPMTLAPGSAPAIGGSCTDPGVGSVSGADTESLEIESFASSETNKTLYDSGTITACCVETFCDGVSVGTNCIDNASPWEHYETESETFSRGGSVRAVPDLEKAIKRINSDFRALIWRSEMPQTLRSGTWSCDFNGSVSSGGGTDEVHPHQAEILLEVENAASAMEDTLGYNSYAPWAQGGSWTKSISYLSIISPYDCPNAEACDDGQTATIITTLEGYTPPPDDESYSASRAYVFPSSVGSSSDMVGYLGHSQALARYINSWCNPHWSYALWNQPWEVDSSPETWADYWSKVGSQWIYNAALEDPAASRNHLVSEPLDQDGNAAFLDTFFAGLRWLGLCRWQTKEITARSTYTYSSASSSLWSAKDCSISHGASMTVTPSEAVCEIALDLGSFTVEPYQWPHLANQILCNWSTTNVSSIKVYLRGVDGARVLLNDNDRNVTKNKPFALGKKYAGSWAQDFGALVTTDQGADFKPTRGMSAATNADPGRAIAFQGLSDRTADKLVYVITPTDPDDDVVINYPKLDYTLSGERLDVWENAYQCATIHPDGPGVRTGMFFTGTSGTIDNPPAVYDPTTRPNLIDWLVTERLIIRGVPYNDALSTELTTLYDSYEGQSVGQVRNASNAFWLPRGSSSSWFLARVNSMSEIPPMGCLPRLERQLDWTESGDYVQHTWAFCQGPSKFVMPFYTPELRAADDVTVWTSAGTGVTGWLVEQHEHALTNTENDFGVWINETGQRLAILRPWRGHYFIPGGDGTQHGIAYAVRGDRLHFRTMAKSGNAETEFFDNVRTKKGDLATVPATEVCLATSGMKVILGVIDSGIYKVYESTGGAWTLSYSLGTGAANPTVTVGGDTRYHYWLEGTTVRGGIVDNDGNLAGSEFNVTGLGTIDEDGLASAVTIESAGAFKVLLTTIEAGIAVTRASSDGQAFS